jgi:hypothetical protein
MLVAGICVFSVFSVLKKKKQKKKKAHERREAVLTIKPNPLFKNQSEHKKNKTILKGTFKAKEKRKRSMFV